MKLRLPAWAWDTQKLFHGRRRDFTSSLNSADTENIQTSDSHQSVIVKYQETFILFNINKLKLAATMRHWPKILIKIKKNLKILRSI